jgi:hypothetical protein
MRYIRVYADTPRCPGKATSPKSTKHLYQPASITLPSTPRQRTRIRRTSTSKPTSKSKPRPTSPLILATGPTTAGCTITPGRSNVFLRRSRRTGMRRRMIGVQGGRCLGGMMRFVFRPFAVELGGRRSSVQVSGTDACGWNDAVNHDGSMAEDTGIRVGNMVLKSSPSTGYGAHGRLTPGVRRRVRSSAGQHVYNTLSFLSFSNLMIFCRFYRVSN